VLFVHGINGTPRDFKAIIQGLDRKSFQPWVLDYPSGLDLRALGDGLVGILAELRQLLAELCLMTSGCWLSGNYVPSAAVDQW